MKVAIYTVNFGNYRNETNNINKKNHYYDKDIDYYLFTDNNDIKSENWKIILVPLKKKLDFMDKNRHTAKYYKWIRPDILKKYDIIIYIDTKALWGLKFTKEKIIKLFNNKNKHNIYFLKHPERSNPIQELKKTIKCNKENKTNYKKFKKILKSINFKSKLPDSAIRIYRNTNKNFKLLKQVYNKELKFKLRRDQNCINYVFYLNKKESILVFFKPKHLY
jgi:hypothetical protein